MQHLSASKVVAAHPTLPPYERGEVSISCVTVPGHNGTASFSATTLECLDTRQKYSRPAQVIVDSPFTLKKVTDLCRPAETNNIGHVVHAVDNVR